jgi:hypothetical protein
VWGPSGRRALQLGYQTAPRSSGSLRFARFLGFSANITTVIIPANLAERKFRSYWDQTNKSGGNERAPFQQVLRLIEESPRVAEPPIKKGLGNAIVKGFADGKWHPLEKIAQAIDAPENEVKKTLDRRQSEGTYAIVGGQGRPLPWRNPAPARFRRWSELGPHEPGRGGRMGSHWPQLPRSL